jgi:16S rRNA (cytosine967-C5)-methyltransferase
LSATPARRCAFAVVRRTFEDGAYTDRALRAEAERAGLDARERALAIHLAFGTVQRRGTLDHLIERLADRSPSRLDPAVLAALRLGLFQVLYAEGVADHAAVDESVELTREAGSGGHGLVNAVLRRAVREGPGLLAQLRDGTPDEAAIAHSHPEWIARLWWEALGPDAARALMRADNEPAESALRANALVTSADRLAQSLPVPTRPAGPELPEGLVLERPFDAHGSELWGEGAFMPQSRAAMLVSRVVAPEDGHRVLDLCAAPGAKTTHLAALLEGTGEVVAVERHAGRAEALGATCRRMRAANVAVRVADARDPGPDGFDRVLLDPPCSGLGTLQARPDLRWRASPEAVRELVSEQRAMLNAAAAAVRPGGTITYSVCTISPTEGEEQVAWFLGHHAGFAAEDLQSEFGLWKHPSVADHLLSLPHRDATAGFFVARLERER